LKVLGGGRELTPARPKQRALLAMLLLHRGELVASDQLIDALWGERPPETAQTAVHGHVSALRKLLGAERIETRPPGYILHVAPHELDLARFESAVVGAAREADPARRAARLRAALALWEGEPLADLRYEPIAQHAVARLHELRLSALEDRVEADLALGHHHELVPELEALVMQHPFRERLRGQLMLALYRCGRQADALHAFQSGRHCLVEELGIEPGSALRELERRILNQDPSLEIQRPTAAPSPAAAVAPAREERKVVTAVFAELVDRSALDPEDVHVLLAPRQAHVRNELERHGGTVEKFIGDAVMAIFGAPVAHEDDPERAVRAALAVRDWARGNHDTVQLRIGINTGEALVRVGARPDVREPIAAGQVVNTTSGIRTAAPSGVVLVGEQTYRATAEVIDYREADPVALTGVSDPAPVWEALAARSRFGAGASRQALAPLVGRRHELDLLLSAFARVREERSPQLVTLVGVPGIGKTRLVRELFDAIEREPVTVRMGRSLPYGEGVSFWALGEIVKAQAGILESDGADATVRKLRQAVEEVVAERAQVHWLDAHLRPLVGAAAAADAAGGEAFAAWRRFLEALAEAQPLVLVFEDLHWADDALLDFVDEFVDGVGDVALLVLATARPELLERRAGWGGGKPNAATITLPPLVEQATAQLVATLLKRPVLDADHRQALLARIGGNPLYAEQYARALIERGELVELPETIHGIIAARLDALALTEKQLLQDAAVVGKVFWAGSLEAIGGHDHSESEQILRRLDRKQFVQRALHSSVAGQAEYTFRHVLLRDVAYRQIPRAARADKHRRAAEWIESLGRVTDHAELLAGHYTSALDYVRAAGPAEHELVQHTCAATRAAGERALALSAFASAADFFTVALALAARDDPIRPRLLLQRARALYGLGGDGIEISTDALDGFRAAGDLEGAAEAATLAAAFAWVAGDRASADRYVALALDAVASHPRSRAYALALTQQTGFLMLGGRYEESIRMGAVARPLVDELGLDEQRARLHIVVGCARCCVGDEGGLDEIQRGIEVAEATGAPEMQTVGYMNLSSELHFFARLDEARRAWRHYTELAERYGLGRHRRNSRAEASGWAYLDGRWDEAIAIADHLIADADAGDRDFTDSIVLSMRAWIHLARGDALAARHGSEAATRLAQASDLQAQVAAYPVRAAVALATGSSDEADKLASKLVAMGPEMVGGLCACFPTLTAVAWVFRDLGRAREFCEAVLDPDPIKSPWNEASRAICAGDYARAADVIDGIGHPAAAAYARLRAAESLAEAERVGDAAAHLAAARTFYQRVRARQFIRKLEVVEAETLARRP
jgi:DNA-binding SARP family transcriptional activator